MSTLCTKCNKNQAKHQTAVNLNGKLFYMSLCDDCLEDLQTNSQNTSNLNQFSRDLTTHARNGKLDPVIGRDAEIERLVHILCRRTKNNPVLIGDPGTGKTAIVEGLAQKIVSNIVPEPLKGRRVVSLDLAGMLSGAVHRGSFEKRLKDVIDEVVDAKGQVILFLDELHTLIGAGSAQGSIDAANILKPYLARGEVQLVGATTLKEYRIIERDAALERRFQPITVNEPSFEHTIKILEGLRKNYEDHHKVIISKEAIADAVKLSTRYIADRFLPDKAIDLIDEASAALRLDVTSSEPNNLREVLTEIEELEDQLRAESNTEKAGDLKSKLDSLKKVKEELTELWVKTKLDTIPVLEPEHIAKVVSKSTGIPVAELTKDERVRLRGMEGELNTKVIGQEEAVSAVTNAIMRARAGVRSQNRPIGVFMFLGPTGVGKTQLAKSLAESLYGSEEYLVRVDMSEYNEKHNVARLVGSPPGYVGYEEGGQLTEIVRRKPFSVILFDEIEKAHSDVFNTLLQVMDDGILTDGHGRTINFKNTIIIMTSNVGSDLLNKEKIGFTSVVSDEADDLELVTAGDQLIAEKVESSLKQQFKPEFLNRIDDVIVFKSLQKSSIRKIVDTEIEKLAEILKENDIKIRLTPKARNYIADNGFSTNLGARPIRRLIQKEIENRISEVIIGESLKSGDMVEIDSDGKELTINIKESTKVSVNA